MASFVRTTATSSCRFALLQDPAAAELSVHVSALQLLDFRSYASVQIEMEPGTTCFIGGNGQGKTNLVEAVGFLSTLSSHRVAADAPLVRRSCERALIRARIEHPGRTSLVEIELAPGRGTRARVNRQELTKARDVIGHLRTVIFAPEDLAIVKGDPGERRSFLDQLLTQRHPRMAAVRADVDRILRQRNSLLKSAGGARRSTSVHETLGVWDEHLASAGSELLRARLDLIAALRPHASAAYADVAPEGGHLALAYDPSWPMEHEGVDRAEIHAVLTARLVERRSEELDRGLTLTGPHRDDLSVCVRDLPVRGYASHGESWSAALSLRLAAYRMLSDESETGDDPVLILDDVFAELDTARRRALAEVAATAEQVLVTAAVGEDIPEDWDATRVGIALQDDDNGRMSVVIP